ncbi:hypothetical protein SLEP1_g30848 [Rubroshorea leprosula]|uniref:Uncharacterized protein n=1 Tax=Rubroshorea leprosula TaxID=152421 RepID=A0AAV5KAW2_9ROSI|nr:hypothetical protein SLEP1_g30848 [Rubroshorea leprosula]
MLTSLTSSAFPFLDLNLLSQTPFTGLATSAYNSNGLDLDAAVFLFLQPRRFSSAPAL